MMDRIKHYDPAARVSVLTNPKYISTSPAKIRADILFLETNCWYGATPVFIAKILEQRKDLTVCVFWYEELTSNSVVSFFQHGVMGYIDVRERLESVQEGIKKILHGVMYIPERYKQLIEKSAYDNFNNDSLLRSEYWLCRLISFGLELESCAEIMKVTLSTARFYKAQVYKKLNVHSTVALVEKCKQLGIVKPDDVFQNILSDDEKKIICKERKNVCTDEDDGYPVV
jgi:DNA-binding CsgD family transcriptional regulator